MLANLKRQITSWTDPGILFGINNMVALSKGRTFTDRLLYDPVGEAFLATIGMKIVAELMPTPSENGGQAAKAYKAVHTFARDPNSGLAVTSLGMFAKLGFQMAGCEACFAQPSVAFWAPALVTVGFGAAMAFDYFNYVRNNFRQKRALPFLLPSGFPRGMALTALGAMAEGNRFLYSMSEIFLVGPAAVLDFKKQWRGKPINPAYTQLLFAIAGLCSTGLAFCNGQSAKALGLVCLTGAMLRLAKIRNNAFVRQWQTQPVAARPIEGKGITSPVSFMTPRTARPLSALSYPA
ncbi:MAG TPA: hypothetical protein VHB73_02630 [Alphaproteobacteria bacterium]|nr:hypothetical protein [Alphaproteobacteria bacterium]